MADEAKKPPKTRPVEPVPVTLAEWAASNLSDQLYLTKVLCVAHKVALSDQKPPQEWQKLLDATKARRIG